MRFDLVKKYALRYVFIVLLGVLMALEYNLFVVGNQFAPAGINGIAVMIQDKFGFSISYMSLLINVPLCVLAYFFIGKKFAINTLLFCVVYSISYLILKEFDTSSLQFIVYKESTEGGVTKIIQDGEPLFPVMIAGLISGFCYGTLMRLNSCTGGTDIVARYVAKKHPTLNFFWVTFIINGIVAISSLFVYGFGGGKLNYQPVCLCLTYCFISSFMGNFIIKGTKSAYKFTIITSYPKEIERDIIEKLKHTSTRVHGFGSFSNEDKEVLICIINKRQIVDMEHILKKYDETFSFVENVNETLGNFLKIK